MKEEKNQDCHYFLFFLYAFTHYLRTEDLANLPFSLPGQTQKSETSSTSGWVWKYLFCHITATLSLLHLSLHLPRLEVPSVLVLLVPLELCAHSQTPQLQWWWKQCCTPGETFSNWNREDLGRHHLLPLPALANRNDRWSSSADWREKRKWVAKMVAP